MLNHLREHSGGIFAKALLGLLVLCFGVWGIGDALRHSGSSTIATVGSESLSITAFQKALARENDDFRRMMGASYTPQMAASARLSERVLERMIFQSLLRQEARHMGIIISDAVVLEDIRNTPAFHDVGGNFDPGLFARNLRALGASEREYSQDIKDSLASQQLTDSIGGIVPVPQALVDRLYSLREEQREADITILSADSIPASKGPDDATLDTFYHDHQRLFTAPEYRRLSYIILSTAQLAAKEPVSAAEIETAYKERYGNKGTPEKGKSLKDLSASIEKELALQKAEDALSKTSTKLEDELAGGATLEEAAQKLGLAVQKTAPVTASGKTQQGAQGEHLPPYENFLSTAFGLEEKAESSLIAAKDGAYFIVRADEIIPESLPPLERVRDRVAAEWSKEAQAKQLAARAQAIAANMQSSKDPLGVAKKEHLPTVSIGPATLQELNALASIGSVKTRMPAALAEMLFSREAGAATGAVRLANGDYAIGIVRRIISMNDRNPSEKERAAAREKIRKELVTAQKADLLEQYLQHLRAHYGVQIHRAVLERFNAEPRE